MATEHQPRRFLCPPIGAPSHDRRRAMLLAELRELRSHRDHEHSHSAADDLLVEYIGDTEIAEAYNSLARWYS